MSFTRQDYQAIFAFARDQYFWHESTGRGYDLQAAVVMQKCEDVIGQQSDFPREARERLAEIPLKIRNQIWTRLQESIS